MCYHSVLALAGCLCSAKSDKVSQAQPAEPAPMPPASPASPASPPASASAAAASASVQTRKAKSYSLVGNCLVHFLTCF